MNKMKSAKLVILFGFLAACTSAPVEKISEPAVKRPVKSAPSQSSPSAEQPFVENIDYEGLQRFLKLDRSFQVLGYSERMFNTCEVGYGYSSTNNCEKRFFIVSHFQLMCRDSEGTISQILTASDLRPIARRQLNWTLKEASGSLQTDSEGYGQIAIVSKQSQRQQRLKISIESDFLYLKAGELKQMITPKNWCSP